jgi:hypothetical protein
MRRIEGFNPSGEVNSYQVIVASVLEKDRRFLCIEELVHSKLKLKQPGGQLEVGETPRHGSVRETSTSTVTHLPPFRSS